jgi:hypothetical protein
MQAIKPLSGVTNLDITAANFPALKFALRPESVLSATQCRDVIGGVILNKASGFVNNGNGTFTGGTGAVASVTGATLPSPLATGKNPMLCVVGTMADGSTFSLGSGGLGYAISTGATPAITRTAGNFHVCPNLTMTGISSGAIGVALDCANNTGAVHAYSGSTYETAATTAVLGTLAGTWDAIGQGSGMLDAGPYYGIYLFLFTLVPSADELKRAIAWMADNPTLGPYPGWYLKD